MSFIGTSSHLNQPSNNYNNNNNNNSNAASNNNNKLVAGYLIGACIGVGSYGEVRYGVNVESGERVAVKIIDLGRFNQQTAALMRKEIKILSLMKHDNIIGIIDVKEDEMYSGEWCDGCACSSYRRIKGSGICANCNHGASEHSDMEARPVLMIMQQLAICGEIFSLIMHTGPFPEPIARLYFRQLLAGLQHCHSLGISHRDLKPENLVLDAEFTLKIVDFGLASLSHPIDSTSSTSRNSDSPINTFSSDTNPDLVPSDDNELVFHSGVGSAPYSAPEVYYVKELYGNAGYRGPPADIFSCAVILFVLLTGRPPFQRPLTQTYGDNMRRCKHFVNIMNGHGFDDVSPAAKDLLLKMLRLNPSERPSIDALLQHEWTCGEIPSKQELNDIMIHRSTTVWQSQHKDELVDVMKTIQNERNQTRCSSSSSLPSSYSVDVGVPSTPNFSPLSSPILAASYPSPAHSAFSYRTTSDSSSSLLDSHHTLSSPLSSTISHIRTASLDTFSLSDLSLESSSQSNIDDITPVDQPLSSPISSVPQPKSLDIPAPSILSSLTNPHQHNNNPPHLPIHHVQSATTSSSRSFSSSSRSPHHQLPINHSSHINNINNNTGPGTPPRHRANSTFHHHHHHHHSINPILRTAPVLHNPLVSLDDSSDTQQNNNNNHNNEPISDNTNNNNSNNSNNIINNNPTNGIHRYTQVITRDGLRAHDILTTLKHTLKSLHLEYEIHNYRKPQNNNNNNNDTSQNTNPIFSPASNPPPSTTNTSASLPPSASSSVHHDGYLIHIIGRYENVPLTARVTITRHQHTKQYIVDVQKLFDCDLMIFYEFFNILCKDIC